MCIIRPFLRVSVLGTSSRARCMLRQHAPSVMQETEGTPLYCAIQHTQQFSWGEVVQCSDKKKALKLACSLCRRQDRSLSDPHPTAHRDKLSIQLAQMSRRVVVRGMPMNNGEPLRVVFIRSKVDGHLISDEPMILLCESAMPPTEQKRFVVWKLGCMGPEIISAHDHTLEAVEPGNREWPLPQLPSTGVDLHSYGQSSSGIGAMPPGHKRCTVWLNPRRVLDDPHTMVNVCALMNENEYAQAPCAISSSSSIAELLCRPPLLVTAPSDRNVEEGLMGFRVPVMRVGMLMGLLHACGIEAEIGYSLQKFSSTEEQTIAWQRVVKEFQDTIFADNIARNYSSWQQDRKNDPRMGRPRRDELNWDSNHLPDCIRKVVEKSNWPPYTMESLAWLICHCACDPGQRQGFVALSKTATTPIRNHIQNERCLAPARRNADVALLLSEKYVERREVITRIQMMRESATSSKDIPEVEEFARISERLASIEADIEHLRARPQSPVVACRAVEDASHLKPPQEEQLIACFYARVVFSPHPNTERIAKTLSWVYNLFGKVARFVGSYKMKQKTYFRKLSRRPGAALANKPLRESRGTRAVRATTSVPKYIAKTENRLNRRLCSTRYNATLQNPDTNETDYLNDPGNDDAAEQDWGY